jgi:hypothetical protein
MAAAAAYNAGPIAFAGMATQLKTVTIEYSCDLSKYGSGTPVGAPNTGGGSGPGGDMAVAIAGLAMLLAGGGSCSSPGAERGQLRYSVFIPNSLFLGGKSRGQRNQ